MDNNEAREILIEHNQWRRGEKDDFQWVNGETAKLIGQAIDCAIQALGDVEEVEPVQDEFTELVDIARHMQSLYRNGRFGLSDEAMTTATAHLDDLRRIPSPPKPKQP